jgi:hypothetical protein
MLEEIYHQALNEGAAAQMRPSQSFVCSGRNVAD